jgi:hypothetical protein
MQRRHALATLPVLPLAVKAIVAGVPTFSSSVEVAMPTEEVLSHYLGGFTVRGAPLLAPGMVLAMRIAGALYQDEEVRFTIQHGGASLAGPCLEETVTGRVHLCEDGPRLLVTQVDEEIVVR